jgi:adenylate kinase
VCCGILYGNGERVLYDHFRKAWTGIPLPLLGEGYNVIPTIHVKDVARLIKNMIF